MNPHLHDAYHAASDHLHAFADWYLTQRDALGLGVFIPIHLGVLILAWCLAGSLRRAATRARTWCTIRAGRHGLRHLESYANNKHTRDLLDEINQPRKETP